MPTTSIRLCTILVAVSGLALAGCKKTEERVKVTDDDRVGVEGRRATDTRRTTQPRGEPGENEIAAKYSVCLGLVNAGNWDQFRKECISDDFVLHEIDDRDIRGHNVNELVSLYAEDAVLSDQAMGEDLKGKTNIAKLNQDLLAAFSDAKVDVPSMFAAGDYVISIGRFIGTNDAEMPAMGLKKSGKKVEVSYADVALIRAGKIAHVWRFRNGMAVGSRRE